MSYSLNCDCHLCCKKEKCLDRHFIEGAINGIHQVWPKERGHFGSGSIMIKCQNFEEPNSTSKKEYCPVGVDGSAGV